VEVLVEAEVLEAEADAAVQWAVVVVHQGEECLWVAGVLLPAEVL
jgi:hypothetical protein